MSTFQPPIHLDPTQDAAQQTAFINQNFQSLAATLETNSFRIVGEGLASLSVSSLSLSSVGAIGTSVSTTIITHGLPFVPLAMVAVSDGSGNFFAPIPLDKKLYSSVRSNGQVGTLHSFSTNSTSLTISVQNYCELYTAGTVSISSGAFTYQYYLLQQSAS